MRHPPATFERELFLPSPDLLAPPRADASARPRRIAAGLLWADLARLGEEVARAVEAGADAVHLDAIDGRWAPTLGLDPATCAAVRRVTRAPIEVHLMLKPVDPLIAAFSAAGADVIVFHPEASDDVERTLALVREQGRRAGLALNPATSLDVLDWTIDRLDLVLVASAHPGRGEEAFDPAALRKVRRVRERLADLGRDVRVEVDGGIDLENAADAARAGADAFVAGPPIFGAKDCRAAVAALRGGLLDRDRRALAAA